MNPRRLIDGWRRLVGIFLRPSRSSLHENPATTFKALAWRLGIKIDEAWCAEWERYLDEPIDAHETTIHGRSVWREAIVSQDHVRRGRMEHRHSEAFCLMRYECAKGCTHFLVWNGRDGATPFILQGLCDECRDFVRHVRWEDDLYSPHHVPEVGDLIFRDGTSEDALKIAKARAEQLGLVGDLRKGIELEEFVDDLAPIIVRERSDGEFAPGWAALGRWGVPDA